MRLAHPDQPGTQGGALRLRRQHESRRRRLATARERQPGQLRVAKLVAAGLEVRAADGSARTPKTRLFTLVLLVADHAGLARFGTVAIDGIKIAANASIDVNRKTDWLPPVHVSPLHSNSSASRRTKPTLKAFATTSPDRWPAAETY